MHCVKRVFWLQTIALIQVCLSLLFAGPNEKFQRITAEQGLPHNNVYSILQDQTGFMWIGTQDGVARFDGYQFQVFAHNPLDENSLSESNFGKIVETPDGILWFGTYGGGLNRFDPKTRMFKRFQHRNNDNTSISDDFIIAMLYANGKIWIATTNGGIDSFDPETEVFSHLGNDSLGRPLLNSNSIRSIFMDPTCVLWVGTFGSGLNRIDLKTNTTTNYRCDPQDPATISHDIVNALCMDGKKRLWIGTRGGGLCYLNTETNEIKRLESIGHGTINDLFINNLMVDHLGILWVGTYSSGLSRLDLDNGVIETFRYDPKNSHSLSQDRIEFLYEDRSNVLWVGTKGGGITLIDLKPQKFFNHSLRSENQTLLSNNISSIGEDMDGTIWVGTDGGGICQLIDRETCRVFLPEEKSLNHRRAWSLKFDQQGRLWVGTFLGLKLFDKETHLFNQVNLPIPESSQLETAIINHIIEDHLGRIWVASSNGLFCIDATTAPMKGRFYAVRPEIRNSRNYISTLYQDTQKQIWLGTDFGMMQLDIQTGNTQLYEHDSKNPDSLSHNRIEWIMEDHRGNFWIGTAAGLNRFERETNRFIHYFDTDGLPNNNIRGIQEDLKGFLWISTNGGLSQFDPVRKTFRNFDISDGLPSNDFNFGSCYKARNGRIYFGGSMGMVSFMPDEVLDNRHIPPIVFTSISIRGKPLPFRAFSDNSVLSLSHEDDVISFEFSALDYTQTRKNHYAYKLEPYDRDWSPSGTRNFGQYTHIRPGSYTLRVIGSNDDNVWNKKGAEFHFKILPPFWATWWFRAGTALFVVLLTIGLYKYRTHNIRKRNTQLQGINLDLQTQIDKRQQAEEKLESAKNYLSHLIDSLSAIVIAVDEKRNITQWNKSAATYTGISSPQALGQPLFEVLPFMSQFQASMKRVNENQRPIQGIRLRLEMGEGYIMSLSVFPLILKRMEGLVIHMDNVTELERKENQLRQAQKMETVGNLAGGLAHDFNNVLGGIIGTTSLLSFFFKKEESISKSTMQKHVMTIESSALRAANIVKRLLSISRKQELHFIVTDLTQVMHNVITLCDTTFDKCIQIQTFFPAKDAWVLADPTQLEQVLLNLCMNASHAMTIMRPPGTRQGGKLILSFEQVEAGPSFCELHNDAEFNSYWRINVSDTGVGMDPNTLSKIFDPFFSTKDHEVGTGLGLSMVYNIVEQHRGFVDVTSETGAGTTFIVYLPVSSGPGLPAKQEEEKPPFEGHGLILIVDDDQVVRNTAREILELCGYDVIEAQDGIECLEIFKVKHGEISVVLLDLVMPRASGEEAYQEMKKVDPFVKVILTSGLRQDARVHKLLDMGVQVFLQKPYTFEKLVDVFSEVLKTENQ